MCQVIGFSMVSIKTNYLIFTAPATLFYLNNLSRNNMISCIGNTRVYQFGYEGCFVKIRFRLTKILELMIFINLLLTIIPSITPTPSSFFLLHAYFAVIIQLFIPLLRRVCSIALLSSSSVLHPLVVGCCSDWP